MKNNTTALWTIIKTLISNDNLWYTASMGYIYMSSLRTYSFIFVMMLLSVFILQNLVYSVYAIDTDDKLEELQKLEKKEKKYIKILDLKNKEISSIAVQIMGLDKQTSVLESDIKENKVVITELNGSIDALEKDIYKKVTALALQKSVLAHVLRARYDNHAYTTQLAQLTGTATHRTLFGGADSAGHIATHVGDVISIINNERKALEKDKNKLDIKKSAVADEISNLSKRTAHLETTKGQKQALATQANTEKKTYAKKLNKVREDQLRIQSEIDSLSVTQIGNFSLGSFPSKGASGFRRPVKSPYVLTQGYGKTPHTHLAYTYHNGVDYVARLDKSIIAAAQGKVVSTGDMGRYGYGKWIAIDHGTGLTTLYGHLSSISVSKGKSVGKGTKIGTMGNTGYSTGPHVHFSIFSSATFKIVPSRNVSGVYIPTGGTVNPALYL